MSDTAFSTSEEPLFRKGDHFGGYELERPLGKGGLGAVWLVRHRMLDTLFALKTLDPKVAEERPEFVKRFVQMFDRFAPVLLFLIFARRDFRRFNSVKRLF